MHASIYRQEDSGEEVAGSLDNVHNLVKHEPPGYDKPHVERSLVVNVGRVGQPGFDEVCQRRGSSKHDGGPDTHGRLETITIQEYFKNERQHDTPHPGGAPDDAVGHAFAPGKPLVNVQGTRTIRNTTADPKDDTLGPDELRHAGTKGAQGQRH